MSRYPRNSSSILSYPEHHQMSFPVDSNYYNNSNQYVLNSHQYNGGNNSNQSMTVGRNSFESLTSFLSSSSSLMSSPLYMKPNLDHYGSDFFTNDFYSTHRLVITEKKRIIYYFYSFYTLYYL